MATLDEIGQEKQRIAERLARNGQSWLINSMNWRSPNAF
jgi:hypothetical protein